MPTAARVLPGLNMLHSAHAPASSLQFVDGQELLSALWNSSPCFTYLHAFMALRVTLQVAPAVLCSVLFGGVFVFVVFLVFFLVASLPGW